MAAPCRKEPHALAPPRGRPRVVGAVGPVGRARAVELLAAGHTDSAVAHTLAVDRGTVRRWRSEPAVAAELARARRDREAAGAEALDDARRILAEAAPRAAQALVDALEDTDPRVCLVAAAAVLDRVGMVKGAAAPPPPAPEVVNNEELVAKINRLVASLALEAPATG